MVIEGSRSIPLTNGSGSRRPKNIWIQRIRTRIRNIAVLANGATRLIFLYFLSAEGGEQEGLRGRAAQEGEGVQAAQARAQHREGEVQPDGRQVPGRPADPSGKLGTEKEKFNQMVGKFQADLQTLQVS